MKNVKIFQQGYTLAELVLTIGICAILFGFIGINLFRAQRKVSLDSTLQTLIADIRAQQNKAMVGASDGRASADNYGIYFGQTRYTLFHGLTYNPTDPANFIVNLDQNINVSATTFQNSIVVFLQDSGNVSTFSATKNTVTIKNTAGTEQATVTVNRYGVITNVQ